MQTGLKTFIVCCAAAAIFSAVSACKRAPEKPEEGGFNKKSTNLAVVQPGYELGETVFSADGRRVAFVAKKGGKSVVVFDSKMSAPYEDAKDLVFRRDGRGFAFVAVKAGKECVVVDGEEGTMYDSLGKPFFAPDGRIVYEAGRNGKWIMVAGKNESPAFDMPYAPPIVSPDGKRLIYIEQHYGKKTSNLRACTLEMKNCVQGKDYDRIVDDRNDPLPPRPVYIARKDGKMSVITVDLAASGFVEKEEPWYDEVYSLDISGRGGHLAYLARRGAKFVLVKDSVEMPFPEHDLRSPLVLSKNGQAFVMAVLNGRFFAIVDGKRTGNTYDEMKMPAYSPNGSQLAYAARKDKKWFVVVNGVEGPLFDMVVSPKFSPDGSRLIYRARQDGERFVVVADAQGRPVREHPHYEAVWAPVVSPDGKSVAYGVKSGQELWWKVEPLE